MSFKLRLFGVFSWLVVASTCQTLVAEEPAAAAAQPQPASAQQAEGDLSVEEIRALLSTIDPYRPEAQVATEIDLFGSTSMDALAHGWVMGFKKFHPQANVVISAEGSESVFKRLAENPTSVGMLSRPVREGDLAQLKKAGLKRPVAFQVARDAMGVFVHESNPLEELTYPQLVALFCSKDPSAKITWGDIGVEGELANQPVEIIGRNKTSGTRTYVEKFLFHSQPARKDAAYLASNAEVLKAIENRPNAIGIVDIKSKAKAVKRLDLRDDSTLYDGDEHDVLLGRYPIIRPLTLVIDLGQQGEKGVANRELVRYALTQAGQAQSILAGFFPMDPPTLRGEMSKLDSDDTTKVTDANRGQQTTN